MSHLVQDVDSRGGCACVGQGCVGTLYFSPNFSVNLKLLLKIKSIKMPAIRCYIIATSKILQGFRNFLGEVGRVHDWKGY